MRYIPPIGTDPFSNLAAEEYLLRTLEEPAFRLWKNRDSVIIGRNQNAIAEVSSSYMSENGILLVRRLSGGGAVFHDLGNINYSFFNVAKEEAVRMVADALCRIGLQVELSGRNDIMYQGRKISGTAGCRQGSHTLLHGTLLFNANLERMSQVLTPKRSKFEGKGVSSVSGRVINLSDFLPVTMTANNFEDALRTQFAPRSKEYLFSRVDIDGITKLAEEKYASDDWNYGKSPDFKYSNSRRFSGGTVELHLNVKGGVIEDIAIQGDYFFDRPTEEFCDMLRGCPANREKIAGRLDEETVGQFFCGISCGDVLSLFP